MPWRTPALTLLALVAFACNSLLCRAALGDDSIDPVSFSAIRLVSGVLALTLCVAASRRLDRLRRGSWPGAIALFLYALPFSLAYVDLEAGIGALLLFGAVQMTMLGVALRRGERLSPLQWLGFATALAGLAYLLRPGTNAPPFTGAAAMIVAGIAWGAYSLIGRGSDDPLGDTAGNFLRSAPLALVAAAVATRSLRAEPDGILLAAVSGALTSGGGYALWYAALPHLRASSAAILQLSVPVIAAVGGVALLGEPVTSRLAIAGLAILGGIRLSLAGAGGARK